ncbi:hypothetical protein ACH4Q7_22680 [Streptomyces roseolus]|uniref:hypothetical protein n=1 Tax=Streptomyces roseolus TaxID=67358 RepID=UPI0037A0D9DC
MIEVLVSNNDRHRYPAMIDPTDVHEGFVRPWFDLETARRIAAQTQEDVEEFGHDVIDTVHVFPGGKLNGHEIGLVVVVTWADMHTKDAKQATEVCERSVPDEDGDDAPRYSIGGHPWCWYVLDDDLNAIHPYPGQ